MMEKVSEELACCKIGTKQVLNPLSTTLMSIFRSTEFWNVKTIASCCMRNFLFHNNRFIGSIVISVMKTYIKTLLKYSGV